MDIADQFLKTKKFKQKNYGKMVQIQKKLFDAWALNRLKEEGYDEFQLGYIGFLMNIEENGITNKEMAEKVHVTKQAMSKAIKELEKLEIVTTHPHESDARMSIIYLTERGKELVVMMVKNLKEKTKEYEGLVGKDRFQQALDTMFEIILYEKEKQAKLK
jgi:DNA-binding MarR family transcriptional regulator